MKKWLFSFLFLGSASLQALPLGNPAESILFGEGIFCESICPYGIFQDNLNFRVGYYGDFVFDRKLRVDGNGSGFAKNISNTKIYTNAAYLVLNFCNRCDLFATLGETRLTLEANGVTWFAAGNYATVVKSEEGFSWSLGSRALLWSIGCFHLGLEGQYFMAYCNVDSYRELVTSRPVYPVNHSTYREWQIGTGITYAIGTCTPVIVLPYVGFKWATSKYITDNIEFRNTVPQPVTIFNTKSHRHWGVPLGVTIEFREKIGLEIETRWLDEWAFSAKAQMQF